MRKREAEIGQEDFLDNSLRASANGTSRPVQEGLFGPLRSIIYARNLRSSKVKKPTLIISRRIERIATMI